MALEIASTYRLNDGKSIQEAGTSCLRNSSGSVRIPVLGFGTYKLAAGMECESSVLHALKTGYRLIDTASYYGNEESVGAAVSASGIPREKIFVTTKIWNTEHADPLAAFHRSLARLNISYIDLYLIHWPVPERLTTWKALCKLKDGGKVRSIGVANFTIRHLEELLASTEIVPAVNQVEFTPFLYQKELLEYCRKKKIVLEAYAPLTRGSKFSHPVIAELSAKYSRTPAQIFLRWDLQYGVVPLPKSKTQSRIGENAGIFDFALSAPDMKKLDSLGEDFRVAPDPTKMP